MVADNVEMLDCQGFSLVKSTFLPINAKRKCPEDEVQVHFSSSPVSPPETFKLSDSPPLEVCTLTHTCQLSLPDGFRIDLQHLARDITLGDELPGNITGVRFSPGTEPSIERGSLAASRRTAKKDFGNQIQLRVCVVGGFLHVKVFATGALATTGSRSEADAIAATDLVIASIQRTGVPLKGRSDIELRNALCTGHVGASSAVWDVDQIWDHASSPDEPLLTPHRIKTRGRAAIIEVGSAERDGAHAPRCIIHPSGSVQVMGKVTPAVAADVYRIVRDALARLLHKDPTALRRREVVPRRRAGQTRRLTSTSPCLIESPLIADTTPTLDDAAAVTDAESLLALASALTARCSPPSAKRDLGASPMSSAPTPTPSSRRVRARRPLALPTKSAPFTESAMISEPAVQCIRSCSEEGHLALLALAV